MSPGNMRKNFPDKILVDPPSSVETDTWLPHDVTSMDAWRRVIGDIRDRFGRLDCLVNDAGISLSESIVNTSLDQWRRVLSVTLESVFLSMKAALPLLLESGRSRPGGASVVNVSSTSGLRGSPFSAAYGASKAAVSLLTKTAAKEFGALGYPIRVNSVHPGAVETPMLQTIMRSEVDAGFARSAEGLKASWSNISALKAPWSAPGDSRRSGVSVFACREFHDWGGTRDRWRNSRLK